MAALFLSSLKDLDYSEEYIFDILQSYSKSDFPNDSLKHKKSIGIVGFGAMGKLYTQKLASESYTVNVCDTIENYEKNSIYVSTSTNREFIKLCKNAQEVIMNSDYIMFCTEAHIITDILENIKDKTVFRNKTIGGQASSKSKEVLSFLQFKKKNKLSDLNIICLHNMHGPNVPSKNQNLAIIPVSINSTTDLFFVDDFTDVFESRKHYMTFLQHDKTTANTQGLTHCVFINMGRAWFNMGKYPWLYDSNNTNPLEVVKVNLTFRIFGNNSHIYSNLAIMNPFSKNYIKLFGENVQKINERIESQEDGDLLFCEFKEMFSQVFDKDVNYFSLLGIDDTPVPYDNDENTHLSLLALLKTWHDCHIDPIKDMQLGTPLYKLLLQAVIKLFFNEPLLQVATKSIKYSEDDKMYVSSVLQYADNIMNEDRLNFDKDFVQVVEFFKGDEMEQVKQKAQDMILKLK
ncbi:prephenate dehydrogenase (NADP(+)) [Hanseniaspora uvarum]|nr:prephenate dehydrogenase (NADP(+)) [Hanseniaspora uvarum]